MREKVVNDQTQYILYETNTSIPVPINNSPQKSLPDKSKSFCAYCGSIIQDGQKFCQMCGSQVLK
jgi:rRNA maturation endonuclease Nob1